MSEAGRSGTQIEHYGVRGFDPLELALGEVYRTQRKENKPNFASYVWSCPGCPVQIHLEFQVIDRLGDEIRGTRTPQFECDGILIGRKQSEQGEVNIIDFVPLNASARSPKNGRQAFSDWATAVIDSCPPDRQVVGYYRSALDQRLSVREDDLATIQSWFKDAFTVILIVAPVVGPDANKTLRGGFFVSRGGSVATELSLTFPFSTAELALGKWPSINGRASRLRKLAAAVRSHKHTRAYVNTAALAVLMLAISWVISTEGVKVLPQAIPRASSPARLGLFVEKDGSNFLLFWDPSVQEVIEAKSGKLLISNGSSPPSQVSLTPEQLRFGKMYYASSSLGSKAMFRLEILEESGEEAIESSVWKETAAIGTPRAQSPSRVSFEPKRDPAPSPTRVSDEAARFPAPSVAHPAPVLQPQPLVIAPSMAGEKPPTPPQTSIAGDRSAESLRILPVGADAGIRTRPKALGAAPEVHPAQAMRVAKVVESTDGLTITSEPAGARVLINGSLVGYTPTTVKVLPAGLSFTVTVMKDGFATWVTQRVSTAAASKLNAQLWALPK